MNQYTADESSYVSDSSDDYKVYTKPNAVSIQDDVNTVPIQASPSLPKQAFMMDKNTDFISDTIESSIALSEQEDSVRQTEDNEVASDASTTTDESFVLSLHADEDEESVTMYADLEKEETKFSPATNSKRITSNKESSPWKSLVEDLEYADFTNKIIPVTHKNPYPYKLETKKTQITKEDEIDLSGLIVPGKRLRNKPTLFVPVVEVKKKRISKQQTHQKEHQRKMSFISSDSNSLLKNRLNASGKSNAKTIEQQKILKKDHLQMIQKMPNGDSNASSRMNQYVGGKLVLQSALGFTESNTSHSLSLSSMSNPNSALHENSSHKNTITEYQSKTQTSQESQINSALHENSSHKNTITEYQSKTQTSQESQINSALHRNCSNSINNSYQTKSQASRRNQIHSSLLTTYSNNPKKFHKNQVQTSQRHQINALDARSFKKNSNNIVNFQSHQQNSGSNQKTYYKKAKEQIQIIQNSPTTSNKIQNYSQHLDQKYSSAASNLLLGSNFNPNPVPNLFNSNILALPNPLLNSQVNHGMQNRHLNINQSSRINQNQVVNNSNINDYGIYGTSGTSHQIPSSTQNNILNSSDQNQVVNNSNINDYGIYGTSGTSHQIPSSTQNNILNSFQTTNNLLMGNAIKNNLLHSLTPYSGTQYQTNCSSYSDHVAANGFQQTTVPNNQHIPPNNITINVTIQQQPDEPINTQSVTNQIQDFVNKNSLLYSGLFQGNNNYYNNNM